MAASHFGDRLSAFASERYRTLRKPQKRVLDGYLQHKDAADVAVELPTGAGKTLVALLIADLALDEGHRVAYLTGTNQLADQVLEQATSLPGLDVIKFFSQHYPPSALAAYHEAQAVGVMNYWTYFNTSPRVEPADLLIFDDAHLAEQPLANLFALRIERKRQALLYDRLCALVVAHPDLSDLYPSVELMREGAARRSDAPELIAFSHWAALTDEAADILANGLSEQDLKFVWPTVRSHLHACGVLIGPSAIEIRPYHPPTQTLPGYLRARQRLYLSATLGTMDDLQRRLGVAQVVNVLEGETEPGAESPVGRRVFLLVPSADAATGARANTLTTSGAAQQPLVFALSQARHAGRTAWLCASHAEADQIEGRLQDQGLETFRLRSGGEDGALEHWLASAAGHLVTAGRYDGFDLAGDVCRLVVLPSVPAASTEFERFVMAYLNDATFMRHRIGQRVTQALGRANRSEDDWAMYLGLDPGFGTMLAQSAVLQAIPADVRPTIDAALARLDGGWAAAEAAAEEFWRVPEDGESGEETPSSVPPPRRRPGRTKPAATAGSAVHEVAAVTQLWLGNPDAAAAAAERAVAALTGAKEIEHAAFWRYVQAQAYYSDSTTGSVGRAIDALRPANEAGVMTAWFARLGQVLAGLRGEQAARVDEQPWLTWDEWIQEAGEGGVRRAVAQCRTGLLGTHDQRAEALELLGRIAGVAAERPVGQGVPDAVWSWPGARRVERRVWEIKTGEPDAVSRGWVDQTLGQVMTARSSGGSRTGSQPRVFGCILTDLMAVDREAVLAAKQDIALLHIDAVATLAELLGNLLLAYVERCGSGSAGERGAAREAVEPRLPQTPNWLAELLRPANGRLLRDEDIRRCFSA